MVKHRSTISTVLLQITAAACFSFSLFLGSPAMADTYKMAFVDVPRAMSASEAAKQARDILNKKLAAKQKEVSVMEEEIKRMKADAEKRKGLTRPEANTDLDNEMRHKFRAYQRLVEDNQAAIDRENGRWTTKITGALLKVIEEIGLEEGFTVVFGKGQVLFAAGSIDITDRVLKRLNMRTKNWF